MRVLIPQPLLSYTSGRDRVEAGGGTLDELLRDLDERFPGIRFRMVDEQDRVRPHVLIFVRGSRTLDLGASLAGSDEVVILQALSGG
jgi:molybdopterin converting factor small subunit